MPGLFRILSAFILSAMVIGTAYAGVVIIEKDRADTGRTAIKRNVIKDRVEIKDESSIKLKGRPDVSATSTVKKPAQKKLLKQPGNITIKPDLEVREFSGDLQKWRKSIVLGEPQTLTFRWSTNVTNAKKAQWEIREGNMFISRSFLPSIPQPGKWQFFTPGYFKHVPEGKHTYTVRVMLFDNKLKQIGQVSDPVTITFKPAHKVLQKITLDDIDILNIGLPPGAVNYTVIGPSGNENITDNNSIKITFKYNLVTSDTAHLSYQFFSGNQYISQFSGIWTTVDKRVGQEKLNGTVYCKTDDQSEVKLTRIRYQLADKNNVHNRFVEKTKILDIPIRFRCPESPPPDDVTITNIQPESPEGGGFAVDSFFDVTITMGEESPQSEAKETKGVTIHGAKQGEQLTSNNSIAITYDYQLYSGNNGEIRQWALMENGDSAPNSFWTWAPVTKGKGNAVNRLTIQCKSATQEDTHIRGIRYRLYNKGHTMLLVEKVRPVDYTFTCKYKRLKIIPK